MMVNGLPVAIDKLPPIVDKTQFLEKEYLPQIQFAQYIEGCNSFSFGKLLDAAGLREADTKLPTLLAFEGGFCQKRYFYKNEQSCEYYQWHFQKTYDVLKFLGVPLLEPKQIIEKRIIANLTYAITNATEKYFYHIKFAKETYPEVIEQEKSIADIFKQLKLGVTLAVDRWMYFEEFNLKNINKIINDSKSFFNRNQMEPIGLDFFLDHEQVRAYKVLEMIDNLEVGK
jgi:hypothetical protein